MQVRAVQVVLLVLSLILSVIILIACSKYAAWSHVMVSAAAGTWLPLVFYVGTIPFFSLLYIVAHLAALQFNRLPTPPLPGNRASVFSKLNGQPYDAGYTVTTTLSILCVSVLHTLVWLGQSFLCTSCELAPILQGHQGKVPKWCPQSRFRDAGKPGLANMLGTLAPVKDVLQWVMFVLAAVLIECARREYMRAEHVKHEQVFKLGAGVDFGGPSQGVNVDFQTKTPGVELTEISGPKLVFRAEEEARLRKEAGEKKRQEAEKTKKNVQFATGPGASAPQVTGPGVPGAKDNYYGNGMGLKRSGTLNYMYESRVAEASALGTMNGSTPPSKVTRSPSKNLPMKPAASAPPGNSNNYYANAMGLQRSGTLNYMYDTRVPNAPTPALNNGSTPQPATVARAPSKALPKPPEATTAGSDNSYGNAGGLKRSGTLNYMYDTRV